MKAQQTRLRGLAVGTALVLGIGGLGACGSSSEGPEAGAVTTQDLQALEEQVGGLEERLGVLEEGGGAAAGEVAAGEGAAVGEEEDNAALFGEEQDSLIGQSVTVSGEVSELITTTGTGSAFRIGGDAGDTPIPVISANPVQGLDPDDVVRITGTVVRVAQDTFEQDFGLAADDLFEDPEAFFAEAEGSVALNASRAQVLQEQADQS